MSRSNVAVVLRLISEVVNKKRLDVIEEVIAEDFVYHNPHVQARKGPTGFREDVMREMIAALPDIHFDVEDLVSQGDKVVLRQTYSATHEGEIWGMPPTARTAVWTGITIFRLENGKIAEEWIIPDRLKLMQELGYAPALS